jgi:hypothetical protein
MLPLPDKQNGRMKMRDDPMTPRIRRKDGLGVCLTLIIVGILFMLVADLAIDAMIAEPQFVDLTREQRQGIVERWRDGK